MVQGTAQDQLTMPNVPRVFMWVKSEWEGSSLHRPYPIVNGEYCMTYINTLRKHDGIMYVLTQQRYWYTSPSLLSHTARNWRFESQGIRDHYTKQHPHTHNKHKSVHDQGEHRHSAMEFQSGQNCVAEINIVLC